MRLHHSAARAAAECFRPVVPDLVLCTSPRQLKNSESGNETCQSCASTLPIESWYLSRKTLCKSLIMRMDAIWKGALCGYTTSALC